MEVVFKLTFDIDDKSSIEDIEDFKNIVKERANNITDHGSKLLSGYITYVGYKELKRRLHYDVRAFNAVTKQGIMDINKLCSYSEADISKWPNVGPKTLEIILEAINEYKKKEEE